MDEHDRSNPEKTSANAEALPFVSIAMPCLNEEAYIDGCLRSLLEQDYPRERMEILVADGMSVDKTREIVARAAASDSRIRLIDNPDRIQAAGLNAAIRASKGDVIVRMDVHAEYKRDFVRQCVLVLGETSADNVGGAARPRARGFFQRALTAALESPLGIGNSKFRQPDAEGPVDTVFPGAFPRRVFETIGLFDRNAITNEDAEINQRIHAAGGTVYLSRRIVVHYYPRDSFGALARQYFNYGKGRARTLWKHKKLLTLRPAIPFLSLAVGTGLVVTSPWQPFAPVAFGSYALGTLAEAVRVGRRAGVLAIPVVWGIFPVIHASHGAGFAVGLVKYALNPDWGAAELLDTPSARPRPTNPHESNGGGHHLNGAGMAAR